MVIRPCYHIVLTRSHRIRRSAASRQTVPTTRGFARSGLDRSTELIPRRPSPRKNAKLWKPPFRARRHALSGNGHAWSTSPKRSGAILKVFGACSLAQPNWSPPPEPRRNKPSRDIAAQYPAGQWMHCVKLLGQRLAARDFDRRAAEIQIRAAILNGFTVLGIPRTETVS
ncbi:hypothetical protein OAN307_c03730 [Octadecabacter antarcticus 307]|uniref:Uncharacterized protein n=1 Tax=Octadecabacter antarcticus 307 TaxID=391626 RepID=M9R8N7_9RHOB|nr:hypothetical protein OAN307_c03730 [Octadecabacter antarcticus 307]